jgi:hypothetical protein
MLFRPGHDAPGIMQIASCSGGLRRLTRYVAFNRSSLGLPRGRRSGIVLRKGRTAIEAQDAQRRWRVAAKQASACGAKEICNEVRRCSGLERASLPPVLRAAGSTFLAGIQGTGDASGTRSGAVRGHGQVRCQPDAAAGRTGHAAVRSEYCAPARAHEIRRLGCWKRQVRLGRYQLADKGFMFSQGVRLLAPGDRCFCCRGALR